MATEDLDTCLAPEIADAALDHAAEQYSTVASLVRDGHSSQGRLRTARRRLQEAAQAWCQAYRHQDAP